MYARMRCLQVAAGSACLCSPCVDICRRCMQIPEQRSTIMATYTHRVSLTSVAPLRTCIGHAVPFRCIRSDKQMSTCSNIQMHRHSTTVRCGHAAPFRCTLSTTQTQDKRQLQSPALIQSSNQEMQVKTFPPATPLPRPRALFISLQTNTHPDFLEKASDKCDPRVCWEPAIERVTVSSGFWSGGRRLNTSPLGLWYFSGEGNWLFNTTDCI